MNSLPCVSTDMEKILSVEPTNSGSIEDADLRCNLKRKKKKTKKAAYAADDLDKKLKDSMGQAFKSHNDFVKTSMSSDITCHERKNLGVPVIVDALSENLSTVYIPQTFKSRQTQLKNASRNRSAGARDELPRKESPCVVVAECVNPKYGARNSRGSPGKYRKPRMFDQNNASYQADYKQSDSTTSNIHSNNLSAHEDFTEDVVVEWDDMKTQTREPRNESSPRKRNNSMQYATDQNPPRLYSIRNKVLAILTPKSKFCFTGKLRIKVLHGAVHIYGSTISAGDHPMDVYSPRGHSSVAIEASEKSGPISSTDIWASLSAEGINQDNENRLTVDINQIEPGTAIVLLQNLENQLTKFLNTFYPVKLFPRIKSQPCFSWTDPKRAEMILQSNLYFGNSSCKELTIDSRVLGEVAEQMLNTWREGKWTCTFIAGGKNVGKSTTMRYLINSILPVSKKVVVLDLDLGQAECTPSGCISYTLIEEPLIGPNFTHLKQPVYQIYIGDANVTRCITRYIQGVQILINKLSNSPALSHLPIIVNTMGFTQGIGRDIAISTIKLLRPSLVLQIMSERSKNNFSEMLSKEVINQQRVAKASWISKLVGWNVLCEHELRVVQSQAERKSVPGTESWNMEPYQQRELVMISYLSQIVQPTESLTPDCNALPRSINATVPYVESFSSLAISVPRESVPPSHALSVINGNIVALCGMDAPRAAEGSEQASQMRRVGPRILTRPPLSACYGFGIIRGVDMEKGDVLINTPLAPNEMHHVNCLVGCIPVPVPLLQLAQFKNVPYTGGNDALPTSREARRGYFRMRYQNTQVST